MSISKKLVVALGSVAVLLSGILLLTKKQVQNCTHILQDRANQAGQKMLMNNTDGGLFLLTKGIEEGQVLFIGYVGPLTADNLRVQMVNAGLSNVIVDTDGTCQNDGGLTYTIVVGSYIVPQQVPTEL